MNRQQFKKAWNLHRKLQWLYYQQADIECCEICKTLPDKKIELKNLYIQSNSISRELGNFSFDEIWNIVDRCWKDYPHHYKIHLSKKMSTPKSVLRRSFNYLKSNQHRPGYTPLWDDVTLLHKRINNRANQWHKQELISKSLGDAIEYFIPNHRNDRLDNKIITQGYDYPEYFNAIK